MGVPGILVATEDVDGEPDPDPESEGENERAVARGVTMTNVLPELGVLVPIDGEERLARCAGTSACCTVFGDVLPLAFALGAKEVDEEVAEEEAEEAEAKVRMGGGRWCLFFVSFPAMVRVVMVSTESVWACEGV